MFAFQINNMQKILTPFTKGKLSLKNHIVMAPMTRARAIGNVPNDLMVEYYRQRAGAGLIVTEGVAPSPEGLGYSRIPGIFSEAQIAGWKKIADAVHQQQSKIFIQLMHTGRVGHAANLPEGYQIVGASAIAAAGQIWTDTQGMQDHPVPHALSTEEVKTMVKTYVQASVNAVAAGIDGVELHAAHGYLLEQFLNPNSNTRQDAYGGSVLNRTRLILEIATETAARIGAEKVGIRISPCSTFNDQTLYDASEVEATYTHLATELNKIGIAYIHLSWNPVVSAETIEAIRKNFSGTFIVCNGLNPDTAEEKLQTQAADLVAFARHYISNPDLDIRIAQQLPLAEADANSFYSADEKGYTDYPVAAI